MAEFTEIIKIENRMCKGLRCEKCRVSPENNGHSILCSNFKKYYPEEYERICLEWAKENPEVTNADKLYQMVKEAFGEEMYKKIKENIERGNRCLFKSCEKTESCNDCKNNGFWDKPYIEQKGEKNDT